jgi:parallel beta-helix repeat protein
VPYAFRATVAESAETLSKNTGSFTGTVDFANLTADRKFLFPDTSLATTASPGTICVYNGAASNCPAASGSAYYLQNDTVLQTQTNFHIQARDSGVNGTIGGVISGADDGQTVDLLQFRASDDSTVLAAVTASGNLQVASSVDTRTATTLEIGNATATAVNIADTGVTTTIEGDLSVSEAADFDATVNVTGLTTLSGGIVVTSGGNVAFQRNTTDYTATGTQDNVDFGTGALFRITSASALTLNGIAGGTDGRVITLVNASAGTVTIANNASGTPANNVVTGIGGGLSLPQGSSVQLAYDSADNVWRIIGSTATTGAAANRQLSNLDSTDINAALNATANDLTLQTTTSGNIILNSAGTIELQDNTNVTGTLTASVGVQAPSIDTATAVALTIGTTNATNITIGHNAGSFAVDGTNFDLSTAGVLTIAGGQTNDITTQANQNLTVQANGTGTIVLNDTVTAAGTLTFSGVSNDITTGTNEDLTIDANGTGIINLNDTVSVAGNFIVMNTGNVSFQRNTTNYTATGTQDNIDFGTGVLFRITSATALTINGIAGGADGRIITLANASANAVSIANNASGTPANNVVTGIGGTLSIPAGSTVQLAYDSADSVWRVVGGTATGGGGANQQLSNLSGTVAINASLTPGTANTIDLGSSSKAWRTLYADTSVLTPLLDAGSAVALSIGTGNATNITIGHNAGTFAVDGTNFDINTAGVITLAGGQANDITTQANQNLTLQANGTGTIVLNDTVTANGTMTFSGVSTDITTGANEDLTIDANGTGSLQLSDNVIVAADKYLKLTGGTTTTRNSITASDGMLFYDTDTDQLLVYANGKWQAEGREAVLVAASDSSPAAKAAADYIADGTADESEINSAITEATTTTGNNLGSRKVYLFAGTYNTADVISLPNNTLLSGSGSGTVIKFAALGAAVGKNMITNSDTTTGTGITIRDLRLDGNRTNNASGGTQRGIVLNGMGGGTGSSARQGAVIQSVTVTSFKSENVYLTASNNNRIADITTQDSASEGLQLTSTSTNNLITGSNFQGNAGNGFLANTSSSNNTISSNTAQGNTAAGFSVLAANNTFTGNASNGNQYGFFVSTGANGTTVSSNTAQGNSLAAFSLGASGIANNTVTGNTATGGTTGFDIDGTNNTVTGNTAQGNSIGISVNADESSVTGNTVTTTTTYGILVSAANNNIIAGNKVYNSGGATANNGIYLTNADSNNITGNNVTDTSATTTNYAINISASTADTNYIANNTLGGGTINNAGTGTIYGGQVTSGTSGAYLLQPTGTLDLKTAAQASGATAAITLQSGNAASGNSGNITIDSGTASGTTGSVSIGTSNASSILIGKVGVTTTNVGNLTVGSSAGSGTVFVNNGATLNATLPVSNDTDGGALGGGLTAALSVDIYTSFTVNQTTTGQTITIPSPTNTAAGRVIYIANIGSASFGLLGSALNNGSTATLLWNGTAWTFAGADGTSINNQKTAAQNGDFWIQSGGSSTGIGRADGGFQSTSFDTASATALNFGTTNATNIAIGHNAGTLAIDGTNFDLSTAGVITLAGGQTKDITTANASTAAGITIKPGNSTGSNIVGPVLTLQGGAATAGNANGGAVTIAGGAGVGTGTQGLVNLSTSAFTSAVEQSFSSSTSITAGNVDLYSSLPVKAITNAGSVLTIPDPVQATIGRLLYISARSGSLDFTMRLNGTRTPIDIAMKANSTATLIWNGTDWTAAGASSSTDLQSAYNNTLTSAGGAEIVLNPVGGAADGFTIRNNGTTPISGGLLEVQTSIGSNILSVNNNATEYAVNGGAENTTLTGWGAAPAGGTATKYTTLGNNVATGQASIFADTSSTANTGIKNTLNTTLTTNLKYKVSYSVRNATSTPTFTTLDTIYSVNGTTTTATCASNTTSYYNVWTRVDCTFTATSVGASNAIIIRHSDAVEHDFYIDNLSVTVSADVNHAADGDADTAANIGGGTNNWAAVSGSTVTQATSPVYNTNGAVSVATAATSGRGVYNKLSNNIAPTNGTVYRVAFYARGDGTNTATLAVAYTPDNGTSSVSCQDYNTQVVSANAFTLVSCYFTPNGTITNAQIRITQTAGSATTFYVDALSVNLNSNTASNVQIGGANKGGPTSLLTLDRSSSAPIAANNDAYLGSMYYDTTTGRIQCYEADGWGACGSSPDIFVTLTPEYTGAVLNGTGVGVMTADFCGNGAGLSVNTGLCSTSGTSRQYYAWTSPQATEQVYSIYVSYKLPTTFKSFASDDTINLTARTSNTTTGHVTYEVFKSTGSALTACGSATDVTNTTDGANFWSTKPINGNESTSCSFAPGDNVVFKVNMKAYSSAYVYVENLTFTYSNN